MVKKLVDRMIEREGDRQGWKDRKNRKRDSLSLRGRGKRREKSVRVERRESERRERVSGHGYQEKVTGVPTHVEVRLVSLYNFFVLAQVSTFKTFFLFIL